MIIPDFFAVENDKVSLFLDSNAYAAQDLLEYYSTFCGNKDAFVAALIGRLCVLEARQRLDMNHSKFEN